MILTNELKQAARARLRDAQTLLKAKQFDGAVYMCGYAVEVALKVRVCKTLGWLGFPETNREFDNYRSFRTHDLEVLLSLAGVESVVTSRYNVAWSAVSFWNPELRYSRVGFADSARAYAMVESARILLRYLMR